MKEGSAASRRQVQVIRESWSKLFLGDGNNICMVCSHPSDGSVVSGKTARDTRGCTGPRVYRARGPRGDVNQALLHTPIGAVAQALLRLRFPAAVWPDAQTPMAFDPV